MAGPVLSAAEKANLTKAAAQATSAAETYTAAIAAQQAQAQAAAQAASLADSQAKSTLVLQLYAGTWMINYDGAEKGNCQGVSVDVQGLILGTCSAVAVTPVIQVLGQVSADGSTSFTLGGIQATGMFPDTDNASGTWISATGSGTFTMARAK